MQPQQNTPKIGFASLGCAKALVDSERIMTQLRAEGYQFVDGYQDADLVIVNTCGFLDSARDESLDAIGEAMAENGKVIVTGCLGAEPDVIRKAYPQVFEITGPHQYESVMSAVHRALPRQHEPRYDLIPQQGVRLTPRHYAYLKISEGCNNKCSFCIIPDLRGKLISRPLDEVMKEAETLVKSGVEELLVVSQDTSAYGIDLKYADSAWAGQPYQTRFLDLCKALATLGVWVRLHYVYPYPHVDEVIPLMQEGKILPYLDIPFQHASPTVLKAMRRPAHQEKTLERIARWRTICPDLTLRSTFIVGFPGETEADFEYLLEWLEEAQLDRVGCFRYENVERAASHHFANAVPEEVKEERWHRFMQTQQRISEQRLKRFVGREMTLLVDGYEDGHIIGRTIADAPEIDGLVTIASTRRILPGKKVQIRITQTDAYDMQGEFI